MAGKKLKFKVRASSLLIVFFCVKLKKVLYIYNTFFCYCKGNIVLIFGTSERRSPFMGDYNEAKSLQPTRLNKLSKYEFSTKKII